MLNGMKTTLQDKTNVALGRLRKKNCKAQKLF